MLSCGGLLCYLLAVFCAKKRPPKTSKNEMLVFGLCSTSDDQLSDPSDASWLKCQKRPPISLKNEMLIFGLRLTSNDRPSDPRYESQPKYKKGPQVIEKWNAHFWIMFNFWWLFFQFIVFCVIFWWSISGLLAANFVIFWQSSVQKKAP